MVQDFRQAREDPSRFVGCESSDRRVTFAAPRTTRRALDVSLRPHGLEERAILSKRNIGTFGCLPFLERSCMLFFIYLGPSAFVTGFHDTPISHMLEPTPIGIAKRIDRSQCSKRASQSMHRKHEDIGAKSKLQQREAPRHSSGVFQFLTTVL